MGGGGKSQTTTIRFASYLESSHKRLLNVVYDSYVAAGTAKNPFGGTGLGGFGSSFNTDLLLDFDEALYGSGNNISTLGGLFEIFDDHMITLGLDDTFNAILASTLNGSAVSSIITEESSILTDDLENEQLPRFRAGMRDINSVMSSSFVIGHAILESARTKALSRFSADLKGKLIAVATDRWKVNLSHHHAIVDMYAQLMKFAIAAKLDTHNHNADVKGKWALWIFNPMQYWIQAVNATTGSTNTTTDVAGGSKAAGVIGGAMMGGASTAMIGASMGAKAGALGGPLGIGIGAAVGGLIGLFS